MLFYYISSLQLNLQLQIFSLSSAYVRRSCHISRVVFCMNCCSWQQVLASFLIIGEKRKSICSTEKIWSVRLCQWSNTPDGNLITLVRIQLPQKVTGVQPVIVDRWLTPAWSQCSPFNMLLLSVLTSSSCWLSWKDVICPCNEFIFSTFLLCQSSSWPEIMIAIMHNLTAVTKEQVMM